MTIGDRQLIAVDGGALEVFIAEAPAGAPVIAAAHPADLFNHGTATLLAAAAGNARVVCVNPRGVGGSSPLSAGERYSLEAIVDELEAVRRALSLPPWIFWGMSGGGWLAQLYAHRHPRALTGIIVESACTSFRRRLADPACVASPFHPAWRARLEAAELLDASAHAELASDEDYEWFNISELQIWRRRHGAALLVAPMALPPALSRIMPELWRFDSRAWLASVTTPALVIGGGADPIVPVAHCRAVHELLVDSEWLLVEGAGHVPVTEKRSEVGEGVRRWLGAAGS